jgi:hypothetical protein
MKLVKIICWRIVCVSCCIAVVLIVQIVENTIRNESWRAVLHSLGSHMHLNALCAIFMVASAAFTLD